ncbi:hypothetical protein CBOM_07463 [Ceraceosorus bombacis]|uniref:Transmembrane protein n=1 Tax=Ceraceosorus bombacis TaxID=401625 RepID=A0A0P1BDU5_9BASI|nr:hypothetical protein CBOM_07463 [Ceraceosorus bombacis]
MRTSSSSAGGRLLDRNKGRDNVSPKSATCQRIDDSVSSSPPDRSSSSLERAKELERSGKRLFLFSISCMVLLPFGLLGGWETLWINLRPHLLAYRSEQFATARGADSQEAAPPHWLDFPFCIAYFVPLLAPLITYIVIARWSGYKAFRHA